MKTKFRFEKKIEGSDGGSFYVVVDNYKDTIEEAKALAVNVEHKFPDTGSYRIVAITMDEETFSYTEEEVFVYDYYKEVTRWEVANENIAYAKSRIEEIEASKKRVKTEKGMALKNAEIARLRERIETWEARKAAWEEEK